MNLKTIKFNKFSYILVHVNLFIDIRPRCWWRSCINKHNMNLRITYSYCVIHIQLYYTTAYTFHWVGVSNGEICHGQLGIGQYSYLPSCNQYALKCRSLFRVWRHQNKSYSEPDKGWFRLLSLFNNRLTPHQPIRRQPLVLHRCHLQHHLTLTTGTPRFSARTKRLQMSLAMETSHFTTYLHC